MSRDDSWIGIDLDGTLAEYNGWRGAWHIGKPVPLMLARVKGWIGSGRTVKLLTARASMPPKEFPVEMQTARAAEITEFNKAWAEWCATYGIPVLEVTCEKNCQMVEQWDDRSVQVVPNTGETVSGLFENAQDEIEYLTDRLYKARIWLGAATELLDKLVAAIKGEDTLAGLVARVSDCVTHGRHYARSVRYEDQ